MKVKELLRLMNDHGTKPYVQVFDSGRRRMSILIYEGKPEDVDEETGKMKVNGFVSVGIGHFKVYAS